MLYWFRTPPGVKVGRAALDEDAIRLIEQLNPGIEFDWPRILKGQGSPATEPRSRGQRSASPGHGAIAAGTGPRSDPGQRPPDDPLTEPRSSPPAACQ